MFLDISCVCDAETEIDWLKVLFCTHGSTHIKIYFEKTVSCYLLFIVIPDFPCIILCLLNSGAVRKIT